MIRIHRISGNSMSPLLADGDYVVSIRRWFRLRVGDLVIASHPHYPTLFKRIEKIDLSSGRVLLRGENPDSLTPQQMGWFETDQLQGKVIYSIRASRKPLSGHS